eukprot:1896020-Lingulodinium_polyedra.AAC.1
MADGAGGGSRPPTHQERGFDVHRGVAAGEVRLLALLEGCVSEPTPLDIAMEAACSVCGAAEDHAVAVEPSVCINALCSGAPLGSLQMPSLQ